MPENIKQLWQQRTPAERRTLSIGGVLLAIALLYALLWYPLAQERQRLRTDLPQLRTAAAQMQLQAKEVMRLRNLPPKPSANNLRSALDTTSARSGLGAPAEFMLLDTGRARITYAAASFDNWISLVKMLQAEHGIRLESATVTALAEPGMVKIQAVLAASESQP